jgi:hypothetical protein
MSAQVINLSDRRKERPKAAPNFMGLSLSIFAAHADVSLAMYVSMVDATQHYLRYYRLL